MSFSSWEEFTSAHVGLNRGLWISLIFLTLILSAVWIVKNPALKKAEES